MSSEYVGTLPLDGMAVHTPADRTVESQPDTSAADILTVCVADQSAASSSVAPYDSGVVNLPSVPATSDSQGINYDTSSDGCWCHRYVCPSQGRYFGDRGSFVGFFDPLDGDEARCVEDNVAPFGPMAVWRIMSSFSCDDCSDVYADILDEGVTSIPVAFTKDPYIGLRQVVSERAMRGISGLGGRRARSLSH